MFFEQAREQAQRAYERDGTDAAVSLRHLACVYLCDVLSQAWIDMTQRHDTGERYTDCGALHF